MFLSVFDVFKIGIGPSSSHTMGPMTAAVRFLGTLAKHKDRGAAVGLRVRLYGSLAFAGRGHATNRAVALGLLGYTPADLDPDQAERRLAALFKERRIARVGLSDRGRGRDQAGENSSASARMGSTVTCSPLPVMRTLKATRGATTEKAWRRFLTGLRNGQACLRPSGRAAR